VPGKGKDEGAMKSAAYPSREPVEQVLKRMLGAARETVATGKRKDE
jgi:hypothetical protein